MKRLPIFVYGTLLPGQPNYYIWEEHIISEEPAIFRNGRLLDLGHYPMLIEHSNEQVKGMVISICPSAYEEVISRLDHLEGYDLDNPNRSEYIRFERDVYLSEGAAVTAWVYIGQYKFVNNLPLVSNGDWVRYIQHRRQHIESWWQHINSVSGLHDDLA